ncbi:MAG: serine/threonine protein kinase [Candidatus Xenobiia bacterium LiM19]
MSERVPAPDGQKVRDGRPLLVLPEGAILNHAYKVSYLTVGGMSITYKGTKDGITYFIKEVESSALRNVLSLSQEKSMIERLNHPGIVKCFDFFEQDGFCYLVTEFIEGKPLDSMISPSEEQFLSENVVFDWLQQLYDVFEYLHSQIPKIIYRDLKPSNVIVDRKGRIHLVDFGIARVFKGHQISDTEPMGSTITASPEHYGGQQTDERSDIFTLGATLNYLLTNGRGKDAAPFDFLPVRKINKEVSEDFESIIKKALAIDPADRFQSISEMRGAHLQSGEPSPHSEVSSGHYSDNAKGTVRTAGTVGSETATMELNKGGKKVRRFPAVALLAVAAVVLFFAGSYYQSRDQLSNRNIESGEGGVFKFDEGRVRVTVPKGYLINERSVMSFPLKDKTALIKKDSKGVVRIVQLLIVDQFPSGITVAQAADMHINNKIMADDGAKIVSRQQMVVNNINCYEIVHTIRQILPDGSSNQPVDMIIRQLLFATGHKNDICLIIAITKKENYTKVSSEFDRIFNSLELKK